MIFYTLFWLLIIVISIIYLFIIIWFTIGWSKIKHYYPQKKQFNTKVTVIVPYYNEEKNIEQCLKQLCQQQIQTTEYKIIAINDNSTDNSENIVKKLSETYKQVIPLTNKQKGKKQAISQAVSTTTHELIITTDADCAYTKNWITNIVGYWEQYQPKMIIAPVVLTIQKGLLNKFQYLEFNSLIMATGGACGIKHPIMCNGANLAFCRETYLSLSDPHNKKYVSGDDMFLMHNIKKKYPEEIHFLKSYDATVKTKATNKTKDFFKQRHRWVSKSGGYTDGDTKFTATIVFLNSLLFIIGIVLSIFYKQYIYPLLFLFLTKTLIDYLFFFTTNSFFNHKKYLYLVPLFEIFYSLYVCTISIYSILNPQKTT